MKYTFLFFFCASIALTACNQPKNENQSAKNTDDKSNLKAELSENFYKRLEGTIAGKEIVMHLQNVDNDISGTYYYDGSWLNLAVDTIVSKDSIVLSEYSYYDSYFSQDSKSPKLALKWTGSGFKGTWNSGDKRKSYPVLLNEKYPEGSYELSAGTYTDSVKAISKMPKSPVAVISFEYLKANGTDEQAKWLDNQLKKISGIGVNGNREQGFKKIAADYLTNYKKEITELQKDGPDRGFLTWMNYTDNSQQSVTYNDKGYVVIDYLTDAYTGGAHGNYNSTLFCLDVKNKKQMALSDVVNIDSNSLQKMLEKNLRKLYNIKANDKISTVLFDNFLKPNQNFYFNNHGLAFMYNPYEVASYAQGQIVVFIPFTELKPYLTPTFAERIGAK